MHSLERIIGILKKNKEHLLSKYPVSKIGVFGSFARGDANDQSDIDIAVEISGPMGLSFIAMADEIEKLLGKKTDVVPLRSVKPEFLETVHRDIVYV